MTPKQLAPILYAAERELDNRPAWEDAGPFPRSVARAAAVAALSALKGPRTGRELYDAMGDALQAVGLIRSGPWSDVTEDWRGVYNHVAATFATPPIPVGWPEGFNVGNVCENSTGTAWCAAVLDKGCVVASVSGSSREEATERARLIAHTLATGAAVQADAEPREPAALARLRLDYEALRAAVDGPSGYREQVVALKRERDEAHAEMEAAAGRNVTANTRLLTCQAELKTATEEIATLRAVVAESHAQELRAHERRQRVKGAARQLADLVATARRAELQTMIEKADE